MQSLVVTKNSSLTVRNLSPATKVRLATRAKAKGRSLEAEVRAILDAAAQEKTDRQPDFPDWFLDMVAPGGDDVADFLDSRRAPHKPVEL
ncbi:MAG: plasmid stabilization protein [Hyphomonadaceae bacterium]